MKFAKLLSPILVVILVGAPWPPMAASAQTLSGLTCNRSMIKHLLAQTGPADLRGEVRELAVLNASIAAEMLRCYDSGKGGGPYFGQSPLSDLLQAAGSLSSAGVSWRLAHNEIKQCDALRKAISLYRRAMSDSAVSNPPYVNDQARKVAPLGLNTALRNARLCPLPRLSEVGA